MSLSDLRFSFLPYLLPDRTFIFYPHTNIYIISIIVLFRFLFSLSFVFHLFPHKGKPHMPPSFCLSSSMLKERIKTIFVTFPFLLLWILLTLQTPITRYIIFLIILVNFWSVIALVGLTVPDFPSSCGAQYSHLSFNEVCKITSLEALLTVILL